MKQTKLRTLILAAMFAALTCVATMIIHIPSPIGGYFNLGDCMVLLSAFVLGPVWGTAAGGIGSALADVICGYFVYAPGTLVIKALMALAAALIFCAFAKNGSRFGKTFSGSLLGSVAAEIIMVVGYFLCRCLAMRPVWNPPSQQTCRRQPSALWPVWRCSRCSTARILRPV